MTKLIVALSALLFLATSIHAASSDEISISCNFIKSIHMETNKGKWDFGSKTNELFTLEFKIFTRNITEAAIRGNNGTNHATVSWNMGGINISETSLTGNIITYTIMSEVMGDGSNLAFSLRGITLLGIDAMPSIHAGTCRCTGASIKQISDTLDKHSKQQPR